MTDTQPQKKFQVLDLVVVDGKIGHVVQYRKDLATDPKDKDKKVLAGDGRTTVAFLKVEGEHVSVQRLAFPEDKVIKVDAKAAYAKIAELEAKVKELEAKVAPKEEIKEPAAQ